MDDLELCQSVPAVNIFGAWDPSDFQFRIRISATAFHRVTSPLFNHGYDWDAQLTRGQRQRDGVASGLAARTGWRVPPSSRNPVLPLAPWALRRRGSRFPRRGPRFR